MARTVWAALYTILSIAIGRIVAAGFGLPRWVVSVTAFNNTESLPLLLLESLSTTGILASLVGPGDENDDSSDGPDEQISLLPREFRRSGAKVRDSLVPLGSLVPCVSDPPTKLSEGCSRIRQPTIYRCPPWWV